MKRYFRIYFFFLKLNYRRAVNERANTINGIFASLSWAAFSILAIYVLTYRSSSVFGWSRMEIFILMGVFNIMVGGLFRTIFAKNFNGMTHIIQHGELDGIILKPLSSQFFLSFQYVSMYGFVRVILAIAYTSILLEYANIPITIVSVIQFIPLAILGFTLLYASWFFVMTFSIWFPDLDNLVEILYSADNVTRYPPKVLWEIGVPIFFIFFPQSLVVSTPTKVLLHKLTTFDAILLVGFTCCLLFLSTKFWKFALRYYTSASG